MKQIYFLILSICFGLATTAQQKEGKVIYSRAMQMQIRLNNDNAMSHMMPKSRTDKFELTFGNNQSLWKHIEEEENTDEASGSGMVVRVAVMGANDIIFHDFSNGKKTEQREIMDKKFVVTDSIRKLNWKITGETKNILGHVCQQAIAQRTGKRTQTIMDNGKLERRELNDTTNLVAWFTTEIPVPAGPEVQGQLPGLILALDMNNGRMVYVAQEIKSKADLASIKEPAKGKKVTPDEFVKEREKLMEEMQKNNMGNGNNRIMIRN